MKKSINKFSNKIINVQIVYRTYKNVHPIMQATVENPPFNVNYILPNVQPSLKKFHKIYRDHRDNKIIKYIAGQFDSRLFGAKTKSNIDVIHYIGLMEKELTKLQSNFVLDIEHAMALTKMDYNSDAIPKIIKYLNNKKCTGIICLSQAAAKSLKIMIGDEEFIKLKSKVTIIYPSSKIYSKSKMNNSIIPKNNKIKLLFVGNDCLRKGLHELLIAFTDLPKMIRSKYQLFIVSDDAKEVLRRFTYNNIFQFPAKYSRTDIIEKFFLPADLFVFPTKHDTFGMVIIDALACSTPVLATNQFAIPELIEDDNNGLLLKIDYSVLNEKNVPTNKDRKITESIDIVDKGLVKSIKEKLTILVEDPSILKRLKKNANIFIQPGNKLSIDVRNSKLRNLYEKAIK